MILVLRYVKLVTKLIIILIVLVSFLMYQNRYVARRRISNFQIWKNTLENDNMKYILIWSKDEPDLSILKKEQEAFIENKCLYSNCYVTKDRNFSNNVNRNIHALIISGKNESEPLPFKRDVNQVFVFAAKESADNYPICSSKFNNYFNLTWTYKLSSDIPWNYFTVFDKRGKQIAPKTNVKWIAKFKSLPKKLGVGILRIKKHPVAWFVSNCYTRSKRETFVLQLRNAMKWYGLEVHVIGTCGTRQCPVEKDKECMKVLRRYYFYLAFENSFAVDYVSEKVLKALLHYTVPVVFGGANYSRFLPPHSYINARELGPKKTAAKIASLIMNQTAYLEYFSWHNHYTFSTAPNSICTLCEWLNKRSVRVHGNLRKWWNEPNENCGRRNKRSTIRSKIMSKLLGSTCSLDEAPHLVSFFKDNSIFTVNKAFMARQHLPLS